MSKFLRFMHYLSFWTLVFKLECKSFHLNVHFLYRCGFGSWNFGLVLLKVIEMLQSLNDICIFITKFSLLCVWIYEDYEKLNSFRTWHASKLIFLLRISACAIYTRCISIEIKNSYGADCNEPCQLGAYHFLLSSSGLIFTYNGKQQEVKRGWNLRHVMKKRVHAWKKRQFSTMDQINCRDLMNNRFDISTRAVI